MSQFQPGQEGPANPNYPPVQTMQSNEMFRGQKHAQNALIFGIVGLFFLGIVFGPLAIVNAKKAEALNIPASGGKVLGWIDTIFGVIAIVAFFIIIGSMASMSV